MATSPSVSRRRFLKSASAAFLVAGAPVLKAKADPRRKFRVAIVGVGGKGLHDVLSCAGVGAEIAALCDVDFKRGEEAFRLFPRAARYRDYRQMLDQMADRIDGVVVVTPDHMHFPVAMRALDYGKHIYVQKPLTHTVGEALALKEATRKAGVVSQMGNFGHANEGTRLVKEWIEADAIGPVREIVSWTDRPYWNQGVILPPAEPIPETLDWNLWQGVAAERAYSSDLLPFMWRGFYDYGSGALGDMGGHIMDAPFWALNLRGPVKVSAECEGATLVSGPVSSKVTYEFPARGSLPPLTYTWYDGPRRPPAPEEFDFGRSLSPGGTYYRGDKGVLLAEGDYSRSPRLLPEARMKEFKRPPRTIPRVPQADPYLEWIQACLGEGPAPGSNIVDHSADLTVLLQLGNVAIRAGGVIHWDPETQRCVGRPDADRYIHKSYRIF